MSRPAHRDPLLNPGRNETSSGGHYLVMDGADLERLWHDHADAVHAYAVRRVGHPAAGDVVAKVFLVAFHRTGPIPDPARPWLLGIARNVSRHEQRADGRRLRRESLAAQDPTGRQQSLELDHVALDAIEKAVRGLPHLEQEAILLVAWDQLTPAEAAAAAGCSSAAMRVRLHRARKRLARQFQFQEAHT